MRIISGIAKGRRLVSPPRTKGKPLIRPTSDRAKEALFSIIAPVVQDAAVLDLFAGTGALGLEALSRGASSAVFVDKHPLSVELISKNIQLCGFQSRSRVLQRDLTGKLSFLEELGSAPFSLIFLDPPYGTGLTHGLLAQVASSRLLASHGLVVAEDEAGERLPEEIGRLRLVDQRRYGDSCFWFYRWA